MLTWLGANFLNAFISAILAESGLSILGLGPQQEMTLGTMIYWSLSYSSIFLNLWWWWLIPVVTLMALFLSLYLVHLGLDESQPRLRTQAYLASASFSISISIHVVDNCKLTLYNYPVILSFRTKSSNASIPHTGAGCRPIWSSGFGHPRVARCGTEPTHLTTVHETAPAQAQAPNSLSLYLIHLGLDEVGNPRLRTQA